MRRDPSKILTEVVEKLSMTVELTAVTRVVAEAARELTGAQGATFVLRDGDNCYYADENAISPLWKGKRFPIATCISGWSMLNRQVVSIPDIYQDARIPHDAYRPTFVKSLCMVPIRAENPLGAIGNYWADGYLPTDEEIKLLQVLANSSAIALENLELKQNVLSASRQNGDIADHRRELETAIHTLAHDLRNPLATMMLFTELLQEKLKGRIDERLDGYMTSILATGTRANVQIRRMLSLYGATHRRLDRKPVNLTAMALEIAEELKAMEPDRLVEVQIASDMRTVADPVLVRLAIDNLMSNAFKYTAKKDVARIEVGQVNAETNEAVFFVRDNGAGFAPGDETRLFRPLVRLHDTTDFPGTGLGLASVARIIELHGGTIRAEGRLNEGAAFYFALPNPA